MKHTEEPWFVDAKGHVYAEKFYKPAPFTDEEGVHHPDFHSGLIALPYSCGGGSQEANARLIAAAPDLLNALETLADAAESRGIPACAARAAIARAKGEL